MTGIVQPHVVSNLYVFTHTRMWNERIILSSQKYHKSSTYDSCSLFQVFWSHLIAYCENTDQKVSTQNPHKELKLYNFT